MIYVSTFNGRGLSVGGLYSLDGFHLTKLHDVPTTGLCLVEEDIAAVRWSRAGPTQIDIGERTIEVPAVHTHEIAYDGSNLLITSPVTNELLWCNPIDGEVTKKWCPDSAPDSWHISGVSSHGPVITAFSKSTFERGWTEEAIHDSAGLLLNVETGEEVVSGLRCPHSPVWADGSWWWCDSYDGAIHGPTGQVTIAGWTRGLVISEEFVYVGISPTRVNGSRGIGYGMVAVLEKVSLRLVSTILIDEAADVFSLVELA